MLLLGCYLCLLPTLALWHTLQHPYENHTKDDSKVLLVSADDSLNCDICKYCLNLLVYYRFAKIYELYLFSIPVEERAKTTFHFQTYGQNYLRGPPLV